MNYELALKLKEARFPQDNSDYVYTMSNTGLIHAQHVDSQTTAALCDFPSLSELIEACGDAFVNVTRGKDSKWLVNYFEDLETGYEWNDTEGSTPEEAVALLYLALHK